MAKTGVLIVGAGPTGLNLALQLARRGIPARLIEAHDGPGERSRAMGVHARTLEFYRQLGFADEMVADGIEAHRFNLREGRADGDGRVVASVTLEEIGAGLSPYPFMLAYPQDRHERFLIGKLEEAGGRVEWQTKLVGFEDVGSQVQARIVGPNGAEEAVDAAYLCGCDGAHSRVRETLGIGFPGGTYEQLFYVADVKIASGFERDIIANIGEHSLALMFPVRAAGMQRLIGLVRPELSHRTDLTFEEIRGEVEPLVGVEVTEVNWFSTYRVHHRVAERFRVGRAFLLGDAGHIHSPAGGQGMNTGIGDAMNLGWKLADVLRGRASAEILDTYEPERIAFARSLVATTDRAFTPMIAESWTGELFRRVVAPLVLSVATRFGVTRHAIFRTLSQIRIHYPDSPLSAGEAGHVHGGDRLPWTGGEADNFAPLRSLDWQVHVYGDARPELQDACARRGLALHALPWTEGAKEAGLRHDAAYLVRPDGYVGLALPEQDPVALGRYADLWELRFASGALDAAPAAAHAAASAPAL